MECGLVATAVSCKTQLRLALVRPTSSLAFWAGQVNDHTRPVVWGAFGFILASRRCSVRARLSRDREREAKEDAEADAEIARLLAQCDGWGRRTPLRELDVGHKLTGIVRSVRSYCCYVDVGAERDGLCHISHMADFYIKNIHDVVKPGQKITVWVRNVLDDSTKLELSMKPLHAGLRKAMNNPDLQPFKAVGPREWLHGKVHSIQSYGIFVSLATPGMPAEAVNRACGLVHNSHISLTNSETFELGQEVAVRVLAVDEKTKRLSLSMLDGLSIGDTLLPKSIAPFRSIPKDLWLQGTVTRIVWSGIWVSARHPDSAISCLAFVRNADIREHSIENPPEILEPGKEVQLRLTEVDVRTGRVLGSMLP
eukprot:TRINITY_DN17371_c0_g1_i1.p1 TRINITY_DN17371_c0_g1~~TRINITY_DN17371_c0_g1_i1.p1  ORF type:complete len:367 (+),score=46.90 TRINITY_DN17371_c0_g1_i1:209-1309(+)